MRSIDNIFIVGSVLKLNFDGINKDADLKLCTNVVHDNVKLEKVLNAWKSITGFSGKVYPTIDEYEEARKHEKNFDSLKSTVSKIRKRGQNPADAEHNDVLRYRVTCERIGKHSFESPEAARIIGGELQDKYHWLVDLTTYHLEIICKIIKSKLYFIIKLI